MFKLSSKLINKFYFEDYASMFRTIYPAQKQLKDRQTAV